MVDITMIAMAIFGLVGYVILFFGAKEPPHKHQKLIMAIYGVALITIIVAGLTIEWHTVYYWQDLTAFYAIYGFVAFVFLIYTAKGLRPLLQKKEDYYEKRGVEEK
jgi:hypothetical protein